jgi:hypothetical protein
MGTEARVGIKKERLIDGGTEERQKNRQAQQSLPECTADDTLVHRFSAGD